MKRAIAKIRLAPGNAGWFDPLTNIYLTLSEKELSELIYEQTGSDKNFGVIRSKGDQALFGKTTQQMKDKLGIPSNRALADYLPTITIKAKDFATEITIFNGFALKT